MLLQTEIEIFQRAQKQKYKIIKPSKELVLLEKKLEELEKRTIYLQEIELETAIKESEDFMRSHFNLHKILYQKSELINNHFQKYEYVRIADAIKAYKNLLVYIEPYQLPIELLDKEFDFGLTEESNLFFDDLKLLSITPTYFESIKLSSLITDHTPSIISHEITHSQIDSNKGVTEFYYNLELIPVFIQLVHVLENDSANLERDINLRLLHISNAIRVLNNNYTNENAYHLDELFEKTKYLESILKGLMLFEIYLNANKSSQNAIFESIQNIFDGKITVEEVLEKYNVTLKESVKLLTKKYI